MWGRVTGGLLSWVISLSSKLGVITSPMGWKGWPSGNRETTNSGDITLRLLDSVSQPGPDNGVSHLCLVSAAPDPRHNVTNVTTAEGNLWSNVTCCHAPACHWYRVTTLVAGDVRKVCNWPLPPFYLNSPITPSCTICQWWLCIIVNSFAM